MNAEAPRGFLGQPAGFSTLFFTELWERFSYYGMRAILLLFLVGEVTTGGMGLDDATATAIYGLYTAGVYIMSMPGGWVADRLLGSQGAVLWGGSLIATGHLILAAAGFLDHRALFLLGLAVIVLGTGLLKPNISALVGQLHAKSSGGARDAAFTWFYMAINVGAMTGPLLTGWLQQRFGWHIGFLSAAIGMGAGLWWFLRTRALFGTVGLKPQREAAAVARDWRILWIIVAGLVLLAALMFTGVLQVAAVTLSAHAMKVMVAAVGAYFVYLLFFAGLSVQEQRRIVVLLVLVHRQHAVLGRIRTGGLLAHALCRAQHQPHARRLRVPGRVVPVRTGDLGTGLRAAAGQPVDVAGQPGPRSVGDPEVRAGAGRHGIGIPGDGGRGEGGQSQPARRHRQRRTAVAGHHLPAAHAG